MSALPPSQMRDMRKTATGKTDPVGSLAQRWRDIHSSAEKLARLAALSPECTENGAGQFSDLLGNATEWQRDMASQGLDDIDAMMQPGLTALLTITGRGKDPTAPALALWREFHHARDAVLSSVQNDYGQV